MAYQIFVLELLIELVHHLKQTLIDDFDVPSMKSFQLDGDILAIVPIGIPCMDIFYIKRKCYFVLHRLEDLFL